MKIFIALALVCTAILTSFFLSGCARADAASANTDLPLGKTCVVQFRRDALGAAATLPISPLTGSFNGAETAIAGTLKTISADWIVIDHAQRGQLWIARPTVLLLSVQP